MKSGQAGKLHVSQFICKCRDHLFCKCKVKRQCPLNTSKLQESKNTETYGLLTCNCRTNERIKLLGGKHKSRLEAEGAIGGCMRTR